MYCTSCGAHNDDNNFRCIQCSQVIQAAAGGGGGGLQARASWEEPSKADTALVLSLLGLLACQLLGIWGWLTARDELRAIDDGRRDPAKRSTAQAAWWMAVISMVLFGVSLVVVVAAVVFVVAAGPGRF